MPELEENSDREAAGAPVEMPIIDSQEIFKKSKMVIIQHQNTAYRLMITRQGKLILTK